MARTSRFRVPKSRHHLWIADSDWDELERLFGTPHGVNPVGVSFAVNQIISKALRAMRENTTIASQHLPPLASPEEESED